MKTENKDVLREVPDSDLGRDLTKLMVKYHRNAAVLLAFGREGHLAILDAVSCGEGSLADYMRVLADRLATSINAGQFDPTNPKEAA